MKNWISKSLAFLLLIFHMGLAYAGEINILPVRIDNGLRIIFKGDTEEFNFKYDDGYLIIRFADNTSFRDTGGLSVYSDILESLNVEDSRLIIRLIDKKAEVITYNEGGEVGIEIHSKDTLGFLVEKLREQAAEKQAEPDQIKISAKPDNGAIISFGFKMNAAAAAVVRDNRILLVFDTPNLFKAPVESTEIIQDVKIYEIDKQSTLVEITFNQALAKNKNILVYRMQNNWNVDFSDSTIKQKDISIITRPEAAPLPRVDIVLDEYPKKAINFNDPLIGDQLIAIPLFDSGVGPNNTSTYIDFTIEKSPQGIMIIKKSDLVIVKMYQEVVSISGSVSLNLAQKFYEKRENNFDLSSNKFKLSFFSEDYKTILSLKSFYTPNYNHIKRMRQLIDALRSSKFPEKRARVYANWALYYLANGMYKEGLAMITLLKKEDALFAITYNINVIEAALRYMDRDYMTAYKIMNNVKMNDVPMSLRREVRFWQSVTALKVTNINDNSYNTDPYYVFMNQEQNFLSEYTNRIMINLSALFFKQKLDAKLFNECGALLKRIESYQPLYYRDQNMLNDLYGNFYAFQDKEKEALKFWNRCIEDTADLYNRMLCKYNKLNYLNYAQRLSTEDYIQELTYILAAWRGDDLELKMLKDLGMAYYQKSDYINSLRTWKRITETFQYSADSISLSKKMSEVLVSFFLEGKDEGVPHYKALALFYDFGSLLPIGEVGDRIVLKFIDHLIAVDLLDRASALLTHQITNRLNGYKKEEAINKLAEVHLANKMPQYAIDAINYGDDMILLPDYIAKPRKYLLAEAYRQNHEETSSLQLLKDDYSQQADDMKSNIFWDKQDWSEFDKVAEPRIYALRETTDMLDELDSARVLKLAVSYYMQDKEDLLKGLHKDFNNRMVGKEKFIFNSIMNSLMSTSANREDLQKIIDDLKSAQNQIKPTK